MTLPDITINYWAVLVGGVIPMITGMIWYSPKVFGNLWMSGSNLRPEDINTDNMGKLYFLQFVATLLTAYVLAHFIGYLNAMSFKDGAVVGLWVWVGFLAAGAAGQYIFPPKPFKLFASDTVYKLINIVIVGGLLAVWR